MTTIENLEDDIRTHGLAYVSWAIQYGYVKDCNGRSFRYVAKKWSYYIFILYSIYKRVQQKDFICQAEVNLVLFLL